MTQDARVDTIRGRIRAIADLQSLVVTTELPKGRPLTESELFAVVVRAEEAQRNRITIGGIYRVQRNYVVWLIVSRLPDKPSDAQELAAIESAERRLKLLPDHFSLYPRLALDGDGGIVAQTLPMQDQGAEIIPYEGKYYAAAKNILPVITYEVAGGSGGVSS